MMVMIFSCGLNDSQVAVQDEPGEELPTGDHIILGEGWASSPFSQRGEGRGIVHFPPFCRAAAVRAVQRSRCMRDVGGFRRSSPLQSRGRRLLRVRLVPFAPVSASDRAAHSPDN